MARASHLWLVAALLAWGSIAAHARLQALDTKRPTPSMAYSITLKQQARLCGSYRPVLADLYYLRAVNLFGTKSEHKRGYPGLSRLLWAASCLDGHFVAPYLLAGTALSSVPAQAEAALDLLARGAALRPDIWRLPFFYAFELFERGHLASAAQQMARAAQGPGAPPFVASLAARLAADSGEPRLAIQMLDALAQTTEDEGARDLFEERRRALLWQEECAAWQRALDAYRQRYGGATPSLRAVQEATTEPLPMADPWGAPYLALDGRITSDNAERQLHVQKESHKR